MWGKRKRKRSKQSTYKAFELSDYALSAEALEHSRSYSDLLGFYVASTKRSYIIKDILKTLFFIIILGLLCAMVYMFSCTMDYACSFLDKNQELGEISLETILGIATIVIPAISSLIVAFLKLPEIIAKYLFNIKEDIYMNSIIKNVQDYDRSMFAMEHKINEAIAKNKDDFSPDDPFEDIEEKDDNDSNEELA